MELIIGGRGSGRSTALAGWLKAHDPTHRRVVLCTSTRRREQFIDQFGLRPNQVYTVDEWRGPGHNTFDTVVAIDNADDVLAAAVAYSRIGAVTLTATGALVTELTPGGER
jgi:hypothetical protein